MTKEERWSRGGVLPGGFFFFLIMYLFTFGCAGSLLLRRHLSSCGEQELLFVAIQGLLIAVASLVAELRL